jgi:hypothetical protein
VDLTLLTGFGGEERFNSNDVGWSSSSKPSVLRSRAGPTARASVSLQCVPGLLCGCSATVFSFNAAHDSR